MRLFYIFIFTKQPTLNYKVVKDGKRIALKQINLTRDELLDMIFKIGYYYPNLIINIDQQY